jgi:superoxide dismutase, Cu-Zn family
MNYSIRDLQSTHGSPNESNRHAGDFGNIESDITGLANVNFATHGISLTPGAEDSVLGRAFVVHAKADDLGRGKDAESLKTGNAGARVACCVVTEQH